MTYENQLAIKHEESFYKFASCEEELMLSYDPQGSSKILDGLEVGYINSNTIKMKITSKSARDASNFSERIRFA